MLPKYVYPARDNVKRFEDSKIQREWRERKRREEKEKIKMKSAGKR